MEGTVLMTKRDQFRWRIIEDFRSGRISRAVAAELMAVSEKTVQRLAKRCRERGVSGLTHGNKGKPPAISKDQLLKAKCLSLAEHRYFDFNIQHCLEMLRKHHEVEVSYSTFRRWCRAAGLGKRKKRRSSKARVYRERLGNEGLLLQLDGSHHAWNGSDKWVMIAAIDDATSDIPYAELFPSEDTINCMAVLRRIIEIRGLPEALYVDRAGWFGGLKRQYFSQFVRACDELGIRVIYANSPEAKGRIERAWQTFQDRLIPELRIRKIKAMEAANEYVQKEFLPNYWAKRNTVYAQNPESRYRQLPQDLNLDNIFCLKHERKVRRDQTISFGNATYRVLCEPLGKLAGKDIDIIERENGVLEAFYGHRKLTLKPVLVVTKRFGKYQHVKRPA